MFGYVQLSIRNRRKRIRDFYWSFWRILCKFTFRPLYYRVFIDRCAHIWVILLNSILIFHFDDNSAILPLLYSQDESVIRALSDKFCLFPVSNSCLTHSIARSDCNRCFMQMGDIWKYPLVSHFILPNIHHTRNTGVSRRFRR